MAVAIAVIRDVEACGERWVGSSISAAQFDPPLNPGDLEDPVQLELNFKIPADRAGTIRAVAAADPLDGVSPDVLEIFAQAGHGLSDEDLRNLGVRHKRRLPPSLADGYDTEDPSPDIQLGIRAYEGRFDSAGW